MSEVMGGPSRGPVVMAVTGAMLVLATLFVLLRLISRFGVVRRIAWDDYFMILAWVSLVLRFRQTSLTLIAVPLVWPLIFNHVWHPRGVGNARLRHPR
jgi:hypothetical protein